MFDEAGLEGHNFIMGIGPIFFYILAFPVGILIHQLSRNFCKRWKILETFNKEKQYKLQVITFLYSTCFELNITACISVAKLDQEDFKTFWSFVAIALAFLTLAALLATPAFIYKAARKQHSDVEKYKEKYG